MSGLAGFWNLDGRPADPAILRHLSSTIAHRGPDGEFFWTGGSIGISSQLLRVTPEALRERQPFVHPSGIVVAFDGRLDDREDLLKALGAGNLPADSPDPELVAEAYRVFGEEFASRLDGDFAFALFDPAKQKLFLVRDPVGVRPLYYHRSRATIVFASEIKAVLAHPGVQSRPDEDNLAEYLLRGRDVKPGGTFFEDVHAVPASHFLRAGPEGTSLRQYWDFDPARQVRLKSLPEYAEGFRHYMTQAVRRRIRSAYPVGVSVSGGLDSSAILCLGLTLRRAQPDRWPEVLGFFNSSEKGTPSDEGCFIEDIERAYEVKVQSIPLVPGFVERSPEQVWHGETPMLDPLWDAHTALLEESRRRGCRVILGGAWGDQVLFERQYLVELFRHFNWRMLRTHLRTLPLWHTDVYPGFFRRDFLDNVVRDYIPRALFPVLRRVRSKLRKRRPSWYSERLLDRADMLGAKSEPPVRWGTAHQSAIYSETRKGYHALGLESTNKVTSLYGMDAAFPFLDRDLIAWLLAIPGEAQSWDGVPKALLRQGLAAAIPETIRNRRGKADFTYLLNGETDKVFTHVCDLLGADSHLRSFGLLNEMAVDRLVASRTNLSGRSGATARQIIDLTGMEVWLKSFFAVN